MPFWIDGAYRALHTGTALPTWQEALDDIDAQHQNGATSTPAHVARFGTQVEVKGITAPSKVADRAIRYLTKYLTKSIAGTYTPGTVEADDDDPRDFDGGPARWSPASVQATALRARYEAHIERLHREVR